MPPKIPIKATKKETVAPVLTGNSTNLGTIDTIKKEWKAPTIPRSALVPRKTVSIEPAEVVEKRAHWSDKTIPGMFLDADYICNIIRTKNKKGQEEIEYDWQILPNTGNRFPVSHFYIDNDGDLILSGKVDNSYVTQIVMNDENLAKIVITDTNETTITRRSTSNVDKEQLVEICTLSYGDYNSTFGGSKSKDAEFMGMKLTDYVFYDRRDYTYMDDGKEKVKYCGALMCSADGLEFWTKAIKTIGSHKKSLVFNT